MHPRQIDGASRPAVSGRILVPATTTACRRFPGTLIPSCKRPAPTMQVLHCALCSRISGLNMNPDTDMMPLFARFSLISVLLLSLGGCNTTSVIRDVQLETDPPAKPDKIAVVVMIPDELQRLSTERVLVEDINSSGGNARASSQIRGMRGRLTRDKAEQALREWGADSVVVVFLLRVGKYSGLHVCVQLLLVPQFGGFQDAHYLHVILWVHVPHLHGNILGHRFGRSTDEPLVHS